MYNADDNDELHALFDGPSPGWTAPQHVVVQHVEAALIEAARLANRVFDTPSEGAIIQIFQTMMDRTVLQANAPGHGSVH